MKFYALPRVDGGVEILQCQEDVDPAMCIAKWHSTRRAEITGAIHEIEEADYRAAPAQGPREAWTFKGGKLAIDAAKKAEIDARPPVKTLAERVAALERARTPA